MNRPALVLLGLLLALETARADDFPDFKPGAQDITFAETSPDATPKEMVWRFNAPDEPPDYDITREKFRIWISDKYSHEETWGLFVWVDPGSTPRLPVEWGRELADRKLLAISAYDSGNDRHTYFRCRLAVDGAFNMRKRFHIDPRRVYISGGSGGGRVASILGISYADIFAGAFPIVGADFYKAVLTPDGGAFYPPSFFPDAKVLAAAKRRNRYVLLTGSKDTNRDNTRSVFRRGYKAEGFRHILYLEVPKMGHAWPPADWFAKGLDFLDKDDSPKARKASGAKGRGMGKT
ncbi:MAG TPA: hypothetical protein VG406_11215 [Isosphaeraceae bacterium]|jgi:hypothetical protein|nr:hypothetical protein [Isosphaeraceae bacterium]